MKLNKSKYYYYYKSSLGKIVTRISNKDDYQKYIDSHNGTAPSIPKDTIKINRNIFNNINNIKKISLPSSLKKIDVKCFGKYIGIKINYDNLYEIILKNMSPEGKYEKCLRIEKIYNQRKFINEIKFKDGLLDNIPEGVSIIGEYVFKDISVIKKVYLPESLTAIYKQAFMNTNIENIHFSNNMIYFGEEAFKNCKFLKEIKINKSMRYIKSNVFVGCKKDLKIRIFDEIITFPYKFNLTDNLANRFNLKENNIRAKTKSLRVNDTLYVILNYKLYLINKKDLLKNNNENEITQIFSENLGIKLAIFKKYNIIIPNYNIIKIINNQNILRIKDKSIFKYINQRNISIIKLLIITGLFSNENFKKNYDKVINNLKTYLKTDEEMIDFLDKLFLLVYSNYYYNQKFVSIFLLNEINLKKLIDKYYTNKRIISDLFLTFYSNNYKKILDIWHKSKTTKPFVDWIIENSNININLYALNLNNKEYEMLNKFNEFYNTKKDYERLRFLYQKSLEVLQYTYLIGNIKKLPINVARNNSPVVIRNMNICLNNVKYNEIINKNKEFYRYKNSNFLAEIAKKSDINNAFSNCLMNSCVRLHANGCEYLFESYLDYCCQPFLIYDINTNNSFNIVGGFRLDICRENGICVINSLEILPKAKNFYSKKDIYDFIDAFRNILINFVYLYNKYNNIKIKKITLGQAGHCGLSEDLKFFYKKITNNNYEFKDRKTVSPNRNNHFVIYKGE